MHCIESILITNEIERCIEQIANEIVERDDHERMKLPHRAWDPPNKKSLTGSSPLSSTPPKDKKTRHSQRTAKSSGKGPIAHC